MVSKGWISLHRSIQDHWLYQEDRTFSKYEAWIDLLLMVNHEDRKIMFDDSLIFVARGSCITSVRKLSEKWKWSNNKVVKFFSVLEEEGMLIKKSDTKKTVLTIVNYDFFQSRDLEKRHQSDSKETQEGHQSDTNATQKHTNNNYNNLNNYNNVNNYYQEESSPNENQFSLPKNDVADVVRVYENVFGLASPLIIESINYWCADLSNELVIEALKRSAKSNARNFKYTESILKSWDQQNVKTLDQVEALDKRFESQKTVEVESYERSDDEYDYPF